MAHRAAPLATRSTGGLISAGAGAAFAASQMTRPLKPQWDVRPPQGGIPAWAQPSSIRTRDAPLTDDQPGRTVYHYNDARCWRLRFYQMNSRALTPIFQSSSRAVGAVRDALFGPMCYFEPTRRMMLTTLVGAQRNGIPYMTIPEEEYMGHTWK